MASDHIHVEISSDLATRIREAIPGGLKSTVVRLLVEALISEIEKNGRGILGPLLAKEFDVRTLIVQNLNNQENQDAPIHPSKERRLNSGTPAGRRTCYTPWSEERSELQDRRGERRKILPQSKESTREGETPTSLSHVSKGPDKGAS